MNAPARTPLWRTELPIESPPMVAKKKAAAALHLREVLETHTPHTDVLSLRSPAIRQAILERAVNRSPYWHVEVTSIGTSVLRDARGDDPLRHPDSILRLNNVHLAAQAPTLKEATLALVRRLETMNGGWCRDDELTHLAWTAIMLCTPPAADVMKLYAEQGQVHLDLDEAA